MIPTPLIESALAFTNTSYLEYKKLNYQGLEIGLEIEKFCYYLLSPEFIEKCMPILFPFEIAGSEEGYTEYTAKEFGQAIYEYQSGNEQPLISLLEKI